MLKFLDNRIHQKPAKSPKKYHPQFLYGNSYESPQQFQTGSTLFYKSSYVNPYLNYQQQRVAKLPSQSMSMIEPKWRRKVDLQSVEEQRIVASHPDIEDVKQSRYLKSFYSEYDHNNARFRKSKGQFTAFIEKNDKFKSLGPLHGDQRDQTRINQTKRSVWLKPNKSMYESTGRGSFLQNSDLNYSLRSSISKNSQLITQKQRIRQNREKVYTNYKKSLERRKFDKPNSYLFELPKKGPEHEITFFRHSMGRSTMLQSKIRDVQADEMERDLGRFEMTIYQKIKY